VRSQGHRVMLALADIEPKEHAVTVLTRHIPGPFAASVLVTSHAPVVGIHACDETCTRAAVSLLAIQRCTKPGDTTPPRSCARLGASVMPDLATRSPLDQEPLKTVTGAVWILWVRVWVRNGSSRCLVRTHGDVPCDRFRW